MIERKRGSKLDEALGETFPASDPPAVGAPTSTEPPKRPVDRKPPVITREQIESAQRDEGHRHLRKRPRGAQKHHGLGDDGMRKDDQAEATVVKDHAGLGKSGSRGAK